MCAVRPGQGGTLPFTPSPQLPFTGRLLCTRPVASSFNPCHFLQGSVVCPCFTKEKGKSVEMGVGLQQQMGGGRLESRGVLQALGCRLSVSMSQLLPLPGPQPPLRHPGPDRSQSPFLAPVFCGCMGGGRWGEFCFVPPGVRWPLILGILVTRQDKPVVASVRGLSFGSLLL